MSVLREGSGTRWLTLVAGAFAVTLLALAVWFVADLGGSAAVHSTSDFELEGNIIDDSGVAPPPDWATIFDASGNTILPLPPGGVAATFLIDQRSTSSSTDDTVFAGSNKNNDLIATWNWNTGNSPAKDDLSNVYVYGVIDGTGDLIIYGGLERLPIFGEWWK